MFVYEYECIECDTRMEPSTRASDESPCPKCGSRYGRYATEPQRFEDGYPEGAAELVELCQQREKRRGRQKPINIDMIPVVKEQKIGRNDPCHCGSLRKYKRCHGK